MDEQESIKINVSEIKKGLNNTLDFLKQKKVLNVLFIILFLFLLIGSSWMRLQNLPLLQDVTTGKNIPLALDPFYFLRIAETMLEGDLPSYDAMRYPSVKVAFSNEILPGAVVLLYKISSIFYKEVTIQFINVISPVIFFALGLIAFFFLIYVLTGSKATALISSAFLAVIPTYLYRTMAGFSDHESIGMLAFFLTLLFFTMAIKFLDKKEHSVDWKKTILWGLVVGFLSAFTIASWGGISKFIFMIIPLSFGLFWLIKVQKNDDLENKNLKNYLIFYLIFFLSNILFGLIFGFGLSTILRRVFLGFDSLINGAVLLFIIIDYGMIQFRNKNVFISRKKLKKFRIIISAAITFGLGAILLTLNGTNIFSFIPRLIESLLHPFGIGRVGLTVAENRQPFLNDWIGQIGKIFFWLFLGGLITMGIKISKYIKQNKNKVLFILFWAVFIFGILFSRISASSIFNGTNFISRFFYIGSIILFFSYLIWVYFKDRIKIKSELLVIFSWMFLMLISARGALRLFFIITPFVCFSAGFFIINIFNYAKKSKDDLLKLILWILVILIIIGAIISSNNFLKTTTLQAKYTGPSANVQWQKAMEWVRENTLEESIFVHWWDYGHWVTYLGERRVVTDGGHAISFWDHLIGRYVLTTPFPETALSFMKSHDVSYLLIDQTDIGKYPAYSSIGDGKEESDRRSWIITMTSDPSQTQETREGSMRVYQGGSVLDQDIIYNLNGNQILLPENVAGIGGVTLEMQESSNQISFKQPQGIFIYNQNQINIPIRYLYFNEEVIDFEEGLNALVYVFPRVTQTSQGIQIDNVGSIFYLSPKNMNSLVSQLYILNDPFDRYPTIKLVHSEQDLSVNSLNAQGTNLNEFIYFNGLKGPIKIWKVEYPSNIIAREEFLRTSGDYAEFDNLKFMK